MLSLLPSSLSIMHFDLFTFLPFNYNMIFRLLYLIFMNYCEILLALLSISLSCSPSSL
ncbi:hypothetical protein Sjap_016443 [Stephania japonica]|uniref:Uncharacterized protein n=1 Tax=Stephania japonica TaxID=461633 RepID=A0AAP0IMN0_9MAGN